MSKSTLLGFMVLTVSLSLRPEISKAQIYCNPDIITPVINNCPSDLTFTVLPNECATTVFWPNPFADPDNCTTTNAISAVNFFSFHEGMGNGSNGQLILHGTDSLTIVGTTNGTPGNGNNVFNVCFYATCSGQLSFNWRARMNNGDGFANDRVRLTITHMVHGANVNASLTTGNGAISEGIFASTLIQEGDRFCLEVQSDNTQGVDSITIRDFIFVPDAINVFQTKGPKPGDEVAPGDYQVEYIASDCAGNTSICSFIAHVLLQDPRAVINCPDNITVAINDPANCDILLDYLIPIINDPCQHINGFNNGLDPLINGINRTEEAQVGNGDGIVGTDGYVYLSPGKDSLIMVGINNGTPGNDRNDTSVLSTCIQPSCPGIFTFDWMASIGFGGFRRDEAGIIFNGKDSILADPPGASLALGSVSIHSNGMDPLCFYVRSTNMSMEDTFIIYNFSFTADSVILSQTQGPDLNNPLGPGIYNVDYEATDCHGNSYDCNFSIRVLGSSIACNNLVNVSLDEDCEALISPDMMVNGACTNSMKVNLSLDGKQIPNPVTYNYIKKLITVTILDTITNNSCWGTIYVEDKLPPVLTCPVNDTVFCNRTKYVLISPVVIDNCSPVTRHVLSDVTVKYPCDSILAGKRTISYYYTDASGNHSDTCDQCVYFEKIDPEVDIVWPRDTIFHLGDSLSKICFDTIPGPQHTGVPTAGGEAVYPSWGVCKIALTYEDQLLPVCPYTFKVLRKWTYIDWCRPSGQNVITHYQVIKVIDEKGPIIACGQNVTISTDIWSCTGSVILPSPTVIEECSKTTVQVGYKLVRNGDTATLDGANTNNIVYLGNGFYSISGLPLGLSWVIFRVTDECGNYTDCATEVLVEDQVPPIPVCDQKTVVTLTSDGTAKVSAITFDDGSLDNCGIDRYEARRMDLGVPCGTSNADQWGPYVYFCCADIGKTLMVSMRVWDIHGNNNTCMVEIEVQDKLVPIIVCPPHITVSCEFDYTDLNVFGTVRTNAADRKAIVINDPKATFNGAKIDGYAYDGCGVTIKEFVTYDLKCGQGKIYRRFEATDPGGLVSSCTQIIQINDYTPDNVKVKWPLDYLSNTTCMSKLHLTPDITGKPEITGADKCSNIIQTYDDLIFTLDPDACLKILRKWIVIDWCVYNPNDKTPVGYWTWTQVIKISNVVAPVFQTSCLDRAVDVFGPGCSGQVSLVASALDDCTDSTDLVWSHDVDINNNGTVDGAYSGSGKNASGIYPVGIHKITFRVRDACNNESVCSFLLTVRDAKKPTPYCIGHIVTTVMPSTQSIEIWAKDFNLNSEDNCTQKDKLNYYFLLNGRFEASMLFSCSNIGKNILRVYVVDSSGNSDYCEATLEVQDPNHVCPTGLTVQGKIVTIANGAVKDAIVSWQRQTPAGTNSTYTDANGIFTFPSLTAGMNYTIQAEKNTGFINGVSTYDIVLIQRHILGIQTFDSPYKYLAADVNANCSITAADISEIRRLILGKINAFAQSPSWKFVPTNSIVPTDNPCGFEHSINYSLINRNQMNADFYGIKMGDINIDVDAGNAQNSTSRNANQMPLYYQEQMLGAGNTQRIAIYATEGMSFEGMQMAFELDAQKVQIESIESGQLEITADEYVINGNKVVMSVTQNKGKIVTPKTALFTLVVKSEAEIKLTNQIRMQEEILTAQWYDAEVKIHPITLQSRGSNGSGGEIATVLYQNKPNPFQESTNIGFEISKAQEVEFIFYEMNGKVIHRVTKHYTKGYHEFELKQTELNTFGMLYMQMNTEDFTDTKRLILIR
ncbi:MAG: hypothetical protein WBO31_00245 [Saprospiraceae bacterium]